MKYLVIIILILLFMIIFSNKESFNIYEKKKFIDESSELNNMLENYKIKNFDRNLNFHTLNSTILKHKERLSNLNFLTI